MKDWIKAIVIDASMLWCMAVAYLNIGGVGKLAENAIGFLGALCLVVGIIWLFSYKRSAANKVANGLYKVRSTNYLRYRSVTACLKIAFAAALGWPWVASGFLVAFIAGRAELAEVNRLLADKA